MVQTVSRAPNYYAADRDIDLSRLIPTQRSLASEKIEGTTEVAGAKVSYTYYQPLESTDDIPALIVPGYMGIKPAYDGFGSGLVEEGKPAITMQPIRSQDLRTTFHPNYLFHPSGLPSRATYGVIMDVKNRHGIESFDLVAHSMGGLVASLVAKRHPDKIRSAILISSAGLENHSLATMAGRLPSFLRHELLPNLNSLSTENDAKTLYEIFYYLWRNPFRTCAEGFVVSGCNIRPTLARLGELGVKTAVLNFAADHLICNKAIDEEVGPLVDHIETHPDFSLGHLAPQLAPKVVARSVTEIINKINQ